MAKARRHNNPRRFAPSVQVAEQRTYDEGYGPRNPRFSRHRENREWEEDPLIAAVDIRLSAESEVRGNARTFDEIVAVLYSEGLSGMEVKRFLKGMDRVTKDEGWLLPATLTGVSNSYRTGISDGRQRVTIMVIEELLNRILEQQGADLARDYDTPMW